MLQRCAGLFRWSTENKRIRYEHCTKNWRNEGKKTSDKKVEWIKKKTLKMANGSSWIEFNGIDWKWKRWCEQKSRRKIGYDGWLKWQKKMKVIRLSTCRAMNRRKTDAGMRKGKRLRSKMTLTSSCPM